MGTVRRYLVGAAFLASVAGCARFSIPSNSFDAQGKAQSYAVPVPPASISEITPNEAKRLLDGDPGYVYLDVRTVGEFVLGHVPGALNIPVAQVNRETGLMEMNANFLPVVGANIPKETRVIVGCKSGGRSARAARLMTGAGYLNVFNMACGYSGRKAPTGDIIHPGWSTLGLPTEPGNGDASSYASLRSKARD